MSRKFPLKKIVVAKSLPVGIFYPCLNNSLIRHIEHVLQNHQPASKTNGERRMTCSCRKQGQKFCFQLLPVDGLCQSQQLMLGVQLRAESRFEKKILVLNDGSWLHDDFPDFETKDNTKICKKSLGFSSLFHRENRITSGTTLLTSLSPIKTRNSTRKS